MPALRPKLRPLLGIALTGAAVAALAACGADDEQAAEGGGPAVVASNSIVADVVENVAGDAAGVTTLVGRDGDVHSFEPSPQDVAAIGRADLVIENGLGLEPWMEDVYASSGTDAPLVALADGIEPLPFQEGHDHGDEEDHGHAGEETAAGEGDHGHEGETGHDHGDEEDHGHAGEETAAGEGDHGHEGETGHDHGEEDPHVWQSVPNVRTMAENARDALIEADPENAETYRENADAYLAELDALQEDVVATLADVPAERRVLVTNHDAFSYFADEYGFEVLGDALNSITTVGGDPSASDVAAFVDQIEAAEVPAIFPENTADAGVIETLAREAGVRVAPALYTGALGPEGSEGATYVGMMRYNAGTIADALREGS